MMPQRNQDGIRVLLEKRREELTEALGQLGELHVWPVHEDVGELEQDLLEELAFVECQLGEKLR